ncbi:serine hydrolase domain-containing protein [Saccharothrix coeruleofusca]|uniref:Serine hydrolase n=1 Tax=Saccharothrix coeruleofusca TaxID=33919 RepID=A0A918AL14_9PSEU|nr:serine hydrolase domain-containing protein [Saccharothrix coeruleofusca]GGP40930.1 serine hydrolase [Saccharothrix coeruleofusca]
MLIRTLVLPGVAALFGLSAPDAAPTPAAIDAVVQQYRDATGLPGAAVAVTRGTEVVRAAGYGHTPAGDPVTEHTAMAVASVSKSFTALAVVQLVEAGRVDLDDPVREHLPEFTMADPRADRITVRQLLDQTSGMSDTTFPAFSRPQPDSLAEAVAGMRAARLAADPGARHEYHNPNYQVAARLVEVVSGLPFDDYLRRHVFGPLGMVDSRTADTERDLPPSARGHLVVLGVPIAVPEPPAFGNGSGGVLSSAHDMAAWLIAQNNSGRGPNGGQVASASSIARTHTPSANSGSYALGWSVGTTASGAPVIEHSGDLFTSTAHQALLPGSGYGVAVMANTGLAHGDARAIAERLIALLENTAVPPPSSPLLLVDAVLLVLTLGTVVLAVRGVLRSRRWAAARTSPLRTAVRLLPLLIAPVLCATIDQVVGFLYRGRDVAWVQVVYLYPTFMVLLVTATCGCVAVSLARLVRLRWAQERRKSLLPNHTIGS